MLMNFCSATKNKYNENMINSDFKEYLSKENYSDSTISSYLNSINYISNYYNLDENEFYSYNEKEVQDILKDLENNKEFLDKEKLNHRVNISGLKKYIEFLSRDIKINSKIEKLTIPESTIAVIDEVEKIIFGPKHENERVGKDVLENYYISGVLHASEDKITEIEDDDDEIIDSADTLSSSGFKDNDLNTEIEEENFAGEPPSLFSNKPLVFSISFIVPKDTNSLNIDYSAGMYKQEKEENYLVNKYKEGAFSEEEEIIYKNNDLSYEKKIEALEKINRVIHNDLLIKDRYARTPVKEIFNLGVNEKKTILDNKLEINSLWRNIKNGSIVTVSVRNIQKIELDGKRAGSKENTEKKIYQNRLKINLNQGSFLPYESPEESSNFFNFDIEEKLLRYTYKDSKIYAIGHGTSADWENSNEPKWISSDFLPIEKLMKVNADEKSLNHDCLKSNWLVDDEISKDLKINSIKALTKSYSDWAEEQSLKSESDEESKEIINRILQNVKRIESGITNLKNNENLYKAFIFMNKTMLRQRNMQKDENEFVWRPFQLIYMFLIMNSISDPNSDEREIADLLWFPTGGGKTEAYMGVMLLQIYFDRITSEDKDIKGTCVISRYTLRMLTSQQFLRTATMVTAAEYFRRKNKNILGNTPITLGLWVGSSLTPNLIDFAHKDLERKNNSNPFIIDKCPNCNYKLFDGDNIGIRKKDKDGIDTFQFYCLNSECEFHDILPFNIVDEVLYKDPPTILLGTIDKFAQVALNNKAGIFFGDKKKGYAAPKLILQDELHLLTESLGTIAGIYESAFQTLIKKNGVNPKYLASTATTRNSSNQIQKLFGKKSNLFPPSGISHKDNFFSKQAEEGENLKGVERVYVGIMPQSKGGVQSSFITLASLMASINILKDKLDEKSLDNYWTTLSYFNSIKELGRMSTARKGEINDNLSVINSFYGFSKEDALIINDDNSDELRSNKTSSELTSMLDRLNKKYDDKQSLKLVLSTNIISVGIDVDRLGLMMVFGQPKSTSEYIQATSRIGRSNEIPGIVFTFLRSTFPRDRSHYEGFRSFHRELYKFVEPSTVTPFSVPSRDRVLPAALSIIVRHGEKIECRKVKKDLNIFKEYKENLKSFLQIGEQENKKYDVYNETIEKIDLLIEDWLKKIEKAGNNVLVWNFRNADINNSQDKPLMVHSGSNKAKFDNDPWEVPNSMRNVENEIELISRK